MKSSKKSVRQLVKPLRKLSLRPIEEEKVPTIIKYKEIKQNDIISLLPKEIILKIFSLLSFQDLIRVQLTCRIWYKLALDNFIWKNRLNDLTARFNDIYSHNPNKALEANTLSYKERYCQAITFANWRMGSIQNLIKVDDNNGCRLLSVKLKNGLLVTLTEDNTVKLYQYLIDQSKFEFKLKWYFGDQPNTMIECIDILPDLNILVVAQRGSKCMFYDINKPKHDPIQVLKGGNHPWFIPDSISVNQDYFAVAGRKPSVVFVWNWRKGIKLSNRAFDNQPHNVFLSDHHLITVSVDGLLNVFDIFDNISNASITHYLNACSIPCIGYDNSLNLILAPHRSRRIHHYRWNKKETIVTHDENQFTQRKKRLSFIQFLKNPTNQQQTIPLRPQPSLSSITSKEAYKSARLRRHSSYNDYGYACQMKTDQYIKQNQVEKSNDPLLIPDFNQRPHLIHSIRTTPLGDTAKQIVNVAMHHDRVATVNREGDIAIYALNGTTAARVSMSYFSKQEWMDDDMRREDDDLSDGYDFVRSRLAMGSMGIIYGSKNGSLWWLDFSCRFS